MLLLGIDIGTTNSKVGLFDEQGRTVAIESRPTVAYTHADGYSYYDPEEMWQGFASAVRAVLERAGGRKVGAIGITSMAESGLLVDVETGKARSPFMPWYDTCSQAQAERIAAESDAYERFRASGLRNSFKLGLAKLMWIRDRFPEAFGGSRWLSASSYIAYRLTGSMAIDYTLAARTYAYRIDSKQWDDAWIRHFGFDPAIFPEAIPGTASAGTTVEGAAGLPAGIPVVIAGHDHVVAALAAGAITPGVVYDSMGTAETLVGTLQERPLGRAEFDSGMSYGLHIAPGRLFWMGGNSASGGSVEWLRKLLADEQMSYEKLLSLLASREPGPTGILYYPYLPGSGAPRPDTKARGSFIGLTNKHGKADLIQAVLEGTAYQLQSIRRAAERIAGEPIERLVVVGGGTRNPYWLQTKADVLNATLDLPPVEEATLLGAALAAGVGGGVYGSVEEAAAAVRLEGGRQVAPDAERHERYKRLYEQGYEALQDALRVYFRSL
ncbi:L-fuculokinase [Paenibacillus thermoaerophilus]|uniref:L-fuculokinase n=1 Tax=Paenibacillus thermoaerophilus TaxID=1215385 RepID=A0ABW2V4U6_9BACL|nr:FGGY family carbohydrate kinase [Paenibacillus thermoaerophilus]TMV14381.1 carbohydrate kinase [Paenibacillus thermoaerophilus]